MFIRRTKTRGADRGQVYFSYRLVRSERSGERVRQRTLLNLGSDFGVTPEHWPVLCARIEQLISPQAVLVELGCAEAVEREAQRIAMQLVSRAPAVEGRWRGCASGGCGLLGVGASALGGGGACGAVGHGAGRPGGVVGGAGVQRPATGSGHGVDHRAHGTARVGTGDLAVVVPTQRPSPSLTQEWGISANWGVGSELRY